MKQGSIRWKIALTWLAFLGGCKGCTTPRDPETKGEEPVTEGSPTPGPPKPDHEAASEAEPNLQIFLDALQNKTRSRMMQRQVDPQAYRFEQGPGDVKIIGPRLSTMGTYIINQQAKPSGINIQTPHGDSDLKTRQIAELLCREQKYDSCSTNTVHRRKFDFAHEASSPFQTFTKAIVIHDPKALIVQLHGFEGDKRRSGPAQKARMILSTGSDHRALKAALASLHIDQDPTILVYGIGTHELGATKNVQGRLLQSLGKGHFLHIETSLAFREQLERERQARDFLDSIIRAVKKKYDEEAH